jgi:hypothetical protein
MWFDKSTSTPQVLVVLEYFTLLLIRQDYTPLEDAPPPQDFPLCNNISPMPRVHPSSQVLINVIF